MTNKEKKQGSDNYHVPSFSAVGEFYRKYENVRYRDSLVRTYGAIYHWCRSNAGQARIDQSWLAFELNITREVVSRRMKRLVRDKLVIDTTPDRSNRNHVYEINEPMFEELNDAWRRYREEELEKRKG